MIRRPTRSVAVLAGVALATSALLACTDDDSAVPDARVDAARPTDGLVDAAVDAGQPTRIDELVAALQNPATGESAAEDLHYDVAWNEGWPLHENGRWLFVTHWPDPPAQVSLVGDHNAWDPAAHPASASPWGTHLFVVLTDADIGLPAAGKQYKWWGPGTGGGDDLWRAPPEATAYTYDSYGQIGYISPPTATPWLERFPDHASAFLDTPRTLRAWLPAGFSPRSTAAAGLRLLLLHDGQNVFHPDAMWGGWQVDVTLATGAWPGVIALAVDNTPDRMDDYSHVPDLLPGETAPMGGNAADYLQSLTVEVLPFFRQRYGLSADPLRLMVAGSSMGGLVTLVHTLTRPDTLGCAAALSPTLGWGAFDPAADGGDALATRWPGEVGHGGVPIYLDSGGNPPGGPGGTCNDPDGDSVQEDAADSDNYCVTTQLRDVLTSLGYQFDVDLFHWHEPGAPHNETAWAARFYRALDACDAAGWLPE